LIIKEVERKITGEQFAKALLNIKGVPDNKCNVITEGSKKASETVFSIRGTSKIILRDDSEETSKLITAAHEVGHYINNVNSIKKYIIFKVSGITVIALTFFSLLLVLLDKFKVNIPVISLLLMCGTSFLSSIWANRVKVRDENGANQAAFELLKKHSDEIFMNFGESRRLRQIREEARNQLEEGNRKYKEAHFILTFVSLLPTILFLFLLIV
jgi:hypothetical protein